MAIGDVQAVTGTENVHYVDTGMYDVPEYGSVYVIDGERTAVVDSGTGGDYERIADALDELGIDELDAVILTHVHLDHAGGAGHLLAAHPDAQAYIHERGARHLIEPDRLVAGTKDAVGDQWQYYAEPEPIPEERVTRLADGDEVDLGDRTLVAHEAPGHAPHQHVFHDADAGIVFTGDAAGLYVPAVDSIRETTPPPQFDLDQARRDVSTIVDLEPEILAFSHFGPRAFDEAFLNGYKRTLMEWVEAVRRKRAELGDDDAVIEHFVAHADEMAGAEVWGQRKAEAEARLNARGVLAYLGEGEE
ncbi:MULTISPECIES: MBL fold metallo-hydrolase [Halolamina]|uniref:Glyoxylase, beta-lactamase superfamily II n=1 Tax=Halolamina pelagica TaxID=699431 RepID=A0A1I5PX50_9EURY|nr:MULTISPECIES: MBL fold metallo-hydrolase [Halolamina]NHX34981.1 MBL fold metallo-hydrolase [Halolamina sp. R1-12]SFP38370.1 Glyoxylase, beta-lactamase superfamily II [Halolamina pelagica]